MVLATVPAAPPTTKNQRATSWPAPISAIVPYLLLSRLSASAFSWVAVGCADITIRFSSSTVTFAISPRGAPSPLAASLPSGDFNHPYQGGAAPQTSSVGHWLLADSSRG